MNVAAEDAIHICIVCGETSGDMLGASLIAALRKQLPNARFSGIAGPKMIEAGCEVFFDMQQIAVMGLFEVIRHIPRILSIRRKLFEKISACRPTLFIGIDAPDFNLPLARQLKAAGISTVQYVSPTVWAWRKNRVHSIRQSIDLMLTLFPFEKDFYLEHNVPVQYVGHPLADEIPMEVPKVPAREKLGLDPNRPVLALLPGSRHMEITRLGKPFIQTALACREQFPHLQCVVALTSEQRRTDFQKIQKRFPKAVDFLMVQNDARTVIASADVVLLKSGTSTLETLLIHRPMVVAYRISALTYRLLLRLVKFPYIALPNILAGRAIVPEFIQEKVILAKLTNAVVRYLHSDVTVLEQQFCRIHQQLRVDASQQAAVAIIQQFSLKSPSIPN